MPVVIYDARNSLIVPIKDPRLVGAGKDKQTIPYAPLAPRKKGFPPNIIRLIPGANDLTKEQFKAMIEAQHPKVRKYMASGKIAVVAMNSVTSDLAAAAKAKLPEHLRDIKSLQALDPKEAIFVAENTMEADILQKWIAEEDATVQRSSVLEALQKQLKRVKEVDDSGKPKADKNSTASKKNKDK